MSDVRLTPEEILALIALDAGGGPSREQVSAADLLAFTLGNLDPIASHRLADAAILDVETRQRLTRVSSLVDALELGQRPAAINAFDLEVLTAWSELQSVDTFVGRQSDLAALESLMSRGTRLITITGKGGMGKSSILRKLSASHRVLATVDCHSADSEATFFRTVAFALDLEPGDQPEETVKGHLASETATLFLDGLDHVKGVGSALDRLLDQAPHLQIVATARESFDTRHGTAYALKPLVETDALTFLIQKAKLFVANFQADAHNLTQLNTLCRRLVGVPLALSIAAGCLAQQSVPELLHDLSPARPVIGEVRLAFTHAFNLLSVQERADLRQLDLFAGRFGVEDAAAVLGDDGFQARSKLEGFADRGLVERISDAGQTRYFLHDSIREYLNEIQPLPPETQALAAAQDRYLSHFAHVATLIGGRMNEGQWEAGHRQLQDSGEDVRRALRQSIDRKDRKVTIAIARSLARTYFEAGLLADFETCADSAMQAAEIDDDQKTIIQMLGLKGALASRRGDEELSLSLWRRRLDISRATNDIPAVADSLADLTWQAAEQGQFDSAFAYVDESETVARQIENWELVATAFMVRARLYAKMDRSAEAQNALDTAIQFFPLCKDRDLLLFVRQNLGIVYQQLGMPELAISAILDLLREAAAGHRAVLTGWALRVLAPIFEAENDLERATRCYAASIAVHKEYATKHRAKAEAAAEDFNARSTPATRALFESYAARPWTEHIAFLVGPF